MTTTTKPADLVTNLGKGTFNFSSDTLQIALSNTAPASETSDPTASGNGVLANVTQISYTNYSDDMTVDRVLQSVTWTESGGTATLDAADITITASGGSLATFQYIYIFDQTATAPVDALIVVIDHGSAVSLTAGNSFKLTFNASGIVTVT